LKRTRLLDLRRRRRRREEKVNGG
jgi:hypothetical protein